MLAHLRKRNSCVICGNGQSIICDEVLSGHNDIILINSGIFLDIEPAIYFYERFGLISGETTHSFGIENYLEKNFDFEAILRVISYEMGRTASEVLDVQKIFINPNPSKLGYMNPLLGQPRSIPLNYYSFNEDNVGLYGYHLLQYFRYLRINRILNFRGSIIRAYSAALMIGYDDIYFAGIDPSEYKWWWEEEVAWRFMRNSVKHLLDHFKSVSILRPPHLVKYDNEVGVWSSAPMSWCLRKTILASRVVFHENKIPFPKIHLIGSDPIALSIFKNINK